MGDEKREALLQELRALRARRGLTMSRLQDCPVLLETLNASSIRDAYEQLTAVLFSLGDDLHAQALQNAYGLITNGVTLTQRRQDFGMAAGNRHADTIESWEDKMLPELITLLIANPRKSPPVEQRIDGDVITLTCWNCGMSFEVKIDAAQIRQSMVCPSCHELNQLRPAN